MELWTEYEGRTIDGAFPLNKLLQPEGRSAFFSTSNRKGEPTVIRLVASHFDEEEILSRWRGVEALGHPNILKLEKYGQLILDDTTVVYAVLEPVDANLAEVIAGQRLSLDDTRQLAASLASALQVLHANGFIHEHIEPANIFAVGEIVKLRGDCIREAPEGESGLELKQRDVHDLAAVLLRALTQKTLLDAATREEPLPPPFDQIIANGMSGAWGLPEITAALKPQATAPPQPKPPAAGKSPAPKPITENFTIPAARPANPPSAAPRRLGVPVNSINTTSSRNATSPTSPTRWIAAAALVVLTLVLAGWYVSHQRSEHLGNSSPILASPAPTSPAAEPFTTSTPAPSAPNIPTPKPDRAATGINPQWRVVAFTYNHEDQARKKTATIAAKHPDLDPEVFTPSGHAPYLVTVGGPMTRDQAFAFVQKVRNLGLPHDTYAQNYRH